MVAWSALLVPALVAAVLVFVASSLIHMVIRWHKADFTKLPNEDEVRAAVRKGNPQPGMFVMPYCPDPKEMGTPEMKKKIDEGPLAMLILRPTGPFSMGPYLAKWFLYIVVVSLVVGYIGHSVLPAGADYLKVFQVVGASAWLAYSWSTPAFSIWWGKPWSSTVRDMLDGLIYAAVTAGAYGWLWPKA